MSSRSVGRCRAMIIVTSMMVSFLLTGCGGSNLLGDTQTQIFDGYTFQIDAAYTAVAPALVENKQLINKVVKAFKIANETSGSFEKNMIISRSTLPPELDFQQFRTLNEQKLGTLLVGYTAGTQEIVSFTCGGRMIEGIYVTFQVKDPRYKIAPVVWIGQYQFVDNGKGYIISAAYQTENDVDMLRESIDTLGCVSPAKPT